MDDNDTNIGDQLGQPEFSHNIEISNALSILPKPKPMCLGTLGTRTLRI